jgi:hypothetical protein
MPNHSKKQRERFPTESKSADRLGYRLYAPSLRHMSVSALASSQTR